MLLSLSSLFKLSEKQHSLKAKGLFISFIIIIIVSSTISNLYLNNHWESRENFNEYYLIYPHNCYEEVDPSKFKNSRSENVIWTSATRGEYEPITFVIYALKNIEGLKVKIRDLICGEHAISNDNVKVYFVSRSLQRRWPSLSPRIRNCELVSRFLLSENEVNIKANHFKQVWLTIKVPNNIPSGTYEGAIRIVSNNAPFTEIKLLLEVLPFRLLSPPHKKYGMYFMESLNSKLIEVELTDLREHGVNVLYWSSISINYVKSNDSIKINYDNVERGIKLLLTYGFEGPIIVNTNFVTLAKLLGHKDVMSRTGYELGKSLDSDEEFIKLARKAIEGLLKLKEERNWPELVFTHLDEILWRNRYLLYIRLTKPIKDVFNVKFYITFYFRSYPKCWSLVNVVDPYVDTRCYDGHSIDEWLAYGHSFDELRRELEESGDEAWTYYNPRNIEVSPKWMRIINGLWMWITPFKVHIPWCYYDYEGDPLYDLDGYDYCFAFPVNGTIVPTRLWEAYREGVDDMKYIYTLEVVIKKAKRANIELAFEAER